MKVVSGKLKPRETVITGFTLTFILFAYTTAYLMPTLRENSTLVTENEKLRQELTTNQKALAEATAAAKGPNLTSATATTSNAKPVVRLLAMNVNFADLIRNLGTSDPVFTVNRLALTKQEPMVGYSKNTFNLEIETSFLKLGQFVDSLENSDFLVEITSVEVSRITHELKRCTAKIQLNSYVARDGS